MGKPGIPLCSERRDRWFESNWTDHDSVAEWQRLRFAKPPSEGSIPSAVFIFRAASIQADAFAS
jgi:hypothetical protein